MPYPQPHIITPLLDMWRPDVLTSTTHYNHTFTTCGQHDALSSTTHYNPTFKTCGGLMS